MGRPCDAVPIAQQQQISAALECNVKMEEIINEHRDCIRYPRDVYLEFKEAGFNFLMLFSSLGTYYAEFNVPAKKLFDVTIKAHMLAHGILDAEWINPILGWCYAGEDFMFRVRRLMRGCTFNNTPDKATVAFVKKYVVGLHLVFAKL